MAFSRTTQCLVLAPLLLVAWGCSKKPAENQSQQGQTLTIGEVQPKSDETNGKVQYKANGEVYIPNENKEGKRRWKDAVTYLDGKPLGVLWYSEMPPQIAANPTWIEDVEELPWKPGDKGPKERVIVERRYKFADYLEALGVDLNKIKEFHILGGTHYAMRVTREDILKHRDTFFFNFGRITHGKPLLRIPSDYNANTSLDQVHGIAIYQDKEPPKITEHSEIFFKGKVYTDVPYFGPPLRGGVRTYKDDTLAVWIKRKKLEDTDGIGTWFEGPKGKALRWPFLTFLEKNGVKTSDIVVAEVIFEEKRGRRYQGQELKDLFFTTAVQGSGQIYLGKDRVPANCVAFYTKPQPERVPAMVPANATE